MIYTVDASVALKWFLTEPFTPEAQSLRYGGFELHVPSHFFAEAANGFWKRSRMRDIGHDQARSDFVNLLHAPLTVHDDLGLIMEAQAMALDLQHPVYDMLYAVLAMKQGAPLVTADDRLVATMRRGGLGELVIALREFVREG
jgi:predicted nucleic acid-binding protein